MKQQVVVVVPYYHSDLCLLENISFLCCKEVLKEHPIVLLVPETMSNEDIPIGNGIMFQKIPDMWLKSVESYNEMMLSLPFYELFSDYEYILIYQLDAFVFRDELLRFCAYGYDYIGAPWLHGMKYLKNEKQGVWYVGNGGFSLRKVSAFIKLLRSEKEIDTGVNEDVFFASCNSDEFRVAPLEIALQFSYERDVRECYELSGEKIPFGCHAWEKYDFEFWKPLMQQCNDEVCALLLKTKVSEQMSLSSNSFRHLEADKESIEKCLRRVFREDRSKDIFVFGAGAWGEECCWLLQKANQYKVSCVDNNRNMWGKKLWDVLVQSPDVLKKRMSDDISIIISVKDVKEEIMLQLQEYGFRYGEEVVFYDEVTQQIRANMEGYEND